jgi:serine carboxypeptidase-like clade 1
VQGYIVGNGVTDEQIDGNALVPFVHGMGLISDELFEVKINPIIKSKFETLSFV